MVMDLNDFILGVNYMPKINLRLMIDSLPVVLQGIPYTLGLTLISFILGNVLAILLTLVYLYAPVIFQLMTRFYISFFRGIPALVLLFILYFGLPYQLTAIQAVIICFTMTSSAFLTEIYRGAILGIDEGQWDAAKALGLPFWIIIRKIILPQVFRLSIPALSNVAMDLAKGTSLAAMITVPEMFQKAKMIGGREFDYMTLYVLVAIIYWLICIGIGYLQNRLEKIFHY